MIRELLDRLDGLHTRIRRGHAVNVNDREAKGEAIAIASLYNGIDFHPDSEGSARC